MIWLPAFVHDKNVTYTRTEMRTEMNRWRRYVSRRDPCCLAETVKIYFYEYLDGLTRNGWHRRARVALITWAFYVDQQR